jgi:hypothetical protein
MSDEAEEKEDPFAESVTSSTDFIETKEAEIEEESAEEEAEEEAPAGPSVWESLNDRHNDPGYTPHEDIDAAAAYLVAQEKASRTELGDSNYIQIFGPSDPGFYLDRAKAIDNDPETWSETHFTFIDGTVIDSDPEAAKNKYEQLYEEGLLQVYAKIAAKDSKSYKKKNSPLNKFLDKVNKAMGKANAAAAKAKDKIQGGIDKVKQAQEDAATAYKDSIASLQDKIAGIKAPQIPGNGMLSRALNAMLSKATDALMKAASETFGKLAEAGFSFLSQLKDKLMGALLSNLFIPETVFLKGLQALEPLDPDWQYKNDYVRKVALTHDLALVMAYLDKKIGIKYSNSSSFAISFAKKAGETGSIHVIEYIMNELYREEIEYRKTKELLDDPKDIKKFDDFLLKCRRNQHILFKELIIGSLTHLDTGSMTIASLLTGGELDDLSTLNNKITGTKNVTVSQVISDYEIHPSALGETDKEFGKAAMITAGDLNKFVPFYRFPKKEKKQINPKTGVEETVVDTGSLFGDLASLPNKPSAKMAVEQKFIIPKNFNIKKIYALLASKDLFQEYAMVNKPLYERLKYPIYTSVVEALDKAAAGLFNSGLGKAFTQAIDSTNQAAYLYTKKMENMLFDPMKTVFLSVSDFQYLPPPVSPPPQSKTPPALAKAKLKVTFDPQGGKVFPEYAKLEQNTVLGGLPIPTHKTKLFDGWWSKKNAEGFEIDVRRTKISQDMTIYAYWRDNETVSAKSKGLSMGNGLSDAEYEAIFGPGSSGGGSGGGNSGGSGEGSTPPKKDPMANNPDKDLIEFDFINGDIDDIRFIKALKMQLMGFSKGLTIWWWVDFSKRIVNEHYNPDWFTHLQLPDAGYKYKLINETKEGNYKPSDPEYANAISESGSNWNKYESFLNDSVRYNNFLNITSDTNTVPPAYRNIHSTLSLSYCKKWIDPRSGVEEEKGSKTNDIPPQPTNKHYKMSYKDFLEFVHDFPNYMTDLA